MLTNGLTERISMHHEQTRNFQFHLCTCSRLRIACNSNLIIIWGQTMLGPFWLSQMELTHPYRFAICLVYMCTRNVVLIHRIIPATTAKKKERKKFHINGSNWLGAEHWAWTVYTYFKAINDKQMQNATK